MAQFPALPLFTDAYFADTRHLSTLESGAYLHLLMTAWRTPNCSLPDDDKTLARYAGVDGRTWARIKTVVMAFWSLENGEWVQKRLSKERAYCNKIAEVRRANGQAGGRPKSLNKNENENLAGLLNESKPKAPTPTPIQELDIAKAISNSHAREKNQKADQFDEFWKEYPIKKGKGAARKAYVSAVKKGVSYGELIEAVRKYRASVAGKDPRYTAHASTWLNAERWTDEYQPANGLFGSSDGERAREALAKRFGKLDNQRAVGNPDDDFGSAGGPIIDCSPADTSYER